MHGTSDEVVDIAFARSTVAAFRAQGGTAELREFPGVGHDMPAVVRDDLLAHIQAVTGASAP
jgi:predicted esterase